MRIDIPIGIGYDSNIDIAREKLLPLLTEHKDIKNSPTPSVAVTELADSSVNLELRGFCNAEDYASIYVDILEDALV